MSWTHVRLAGVGDAWRDAMSAALIAAGASAVVETAEGLETYVPAGSMLADVRDVAARAGVAVSAEDVGSVPQPASWTGTVAVQRIGRLTIAPPWLAESVEPDAPPIVIDPSLAFGTGEHPTTRGMLRLMQSVIRHGDTVADLGAGSAILSIAAARLGASAVVAIENDGESIGNAEANVARNGVADRVTVLEGEAGVLLPLVAPVRVVLANIISSVLVRLSPAIRAALAPDGRAILSGILGAEREWLLDGLGRDRWRVEAEDAEGEWWSVVLTPR